MLYSFPKIPYLVLVGVWVRSLNSLRAKMVMCVRASYEFTTIHEESVTSIDQSTSCASLRLHRMKVNHHKSTITSYSTITITTYSTIVRAVLQLYVVESWMCCMLVTYELHTHTFASLCQYYLEVWHDDLVSLCSATVIEFWNSRMIDVVADWY